jgi:hypothetical protein
MKKSSKLRWTRPEEREKISKSKIGKSSWNKGKSFSINTKRLMSVSAKKRMKRIGSPSRRTDVKQKIILHHTGFSSWKEYIEKYPKKLQYKAEVRRETNSQLKQNPKLTNFDKRGKNGVQGAYQLDHIISIDAGFKKHISSKKIGHISNLRMIPWEENISKGNK